MGWSQIVKLRCLVEWIVESDNGMESDSDVDTD